MADITLTITKDGLTPSVVDVARAETLSVDFSGLDAWENSYAVESGTVYAQQFDALMRPLGEDDFELGSFTVTLKPGVCVMDFRVRAVSTTVSRKAMYDVLGVFPVKVCSSDGGGDGDGDDSDDSDFFLVGVTYEDDVPYLDKTWQEIYDAISESKIPIVFANAEGESASLIIIKQAYTADDYELFDTNNATWYAETAEDYPHGETVG